MATAFTYAFNRFFAEDETNITTLLYIQETIVQMVTDIQQTHFDQPLSSEVVSDVLSALLEDDQIA